MQPCLGKTGPCWKRHCSKCCTVGSTTSCAHGLGQAQYFVHAVVGHVKSTAAGQAPKFLGFGTNHPILLPASSGVSFGGGPGGAGVKTHGSDVVEVASATSLHNLTSVLTSTRKNDAFSHHACDDTILNVVLAPKVWRHPHHVHVVNRVCLRLGDGEPHLSLSDGHTVLDTRPTTLLNAWDVFTQLHVFTLLFFSCFLGFAIPVLFRGRAFLPSCALRLMAKKFYSGDVRANPKASKEKGGWREQEKSSAVVLTSHSVVTHPTSRASPAFCTKLGV